MSNSTRTSSSTCVKMSELLETSSKAVYIRQSNWLCEQAYRARFASMIANRAYGISADIAAKKLELVIQR